MHKTEPQHTSIWIAAHRTDRPHGIEITLAGHDAVVGKRGGYLLCRPCRMKRDRGHSSGFGAEFLATKYAGIIPAAEIVKQWGKHPVLMPALQSRDGSCSVRWSALSAMMMRKEAVDIVLSLIHI